MSKSQRWIILVTAVIMWRCLAMAIIAIKIGEKDSWCEGDEGGGRADGWQRFRVFVGVREQREVGVGGGVSFHMPD